MNQQARKLFGIIHIGTVNMTLKIIAYSSLDDMEIIENVAREVRYGEEVFNSHHVNFQSLNEICSILTGFKQLLKDYAVTDVRVLSTTAIREADNLLNVVDQVEIRTGFHIEAVRLPKEIYYKFFGLYYHILKGRFNFADKAVLLVDMTSGGVGLTCWKADRLLFQQNVHIGSLRLMENFTLKERNELAFPTAVREYIYGTLAPLWAYVRQQDIKYIVLSGRAANRIGTIMGLPEVDGIRLLKPETFRDFIFSFNGVTPLKLVQRFKLSDNLANVIMPTLLLYYELLRIVDADMMVMMSTTFTEGYYMHYIAEQTDSPYMQHQRDLLVGLARGLAQRYYYDGGHCARVAAYSRTLFEAVYKRIGLPYRYGYLLQLASVLHEIGKFTNIRKHNDCTYSLIWEMDLFGITDEEKEIVANIAYYAFDGMLRGTTAERYNKLSPSQQIIAAKLIGIFRLAYALDKSHLGKISRIRTELQEHTLLVQYQADLDISLERWTFNKAAVYFAEVFGVSPELVKG